VTASRSGLSFGRGAWDYERGRPQWSGEVIDRAADALALGPGAHVPDLGAGTGKVAQALAERFDRVIAVEPDAPCEPCSTK
jgi:16S rRNA A1518/A1519 N6-dimethyltransferase RsmA/KsgA/DIM1 with predicted DNA glycosylase/AP lyase activity